MVRFHDGLPRTGTDLRTTALAMVLAVALTFFAAGVIWLGATSGMRAGVGPQIHSAFCWRDGVECAP